ncbi:MAG: hypothetical protein FJY65_10255 [Calditrichaeota bacterium]|nr:hypothetical protein [Calditrichota bacterium]
MSPESNENTITAYFLGGVRIYRGRRVLTGFGTQKSLGLFCYILDNYPHPISRDKLMTIFWSESPEDQARYNLRFALWNIRKAVKLREDESDPLLTTRNVCQINPDYDVRIDNREFMALQTCPDGIERIQRLEKALESYQGAFLDGFTLRNLLEWEDWLANRREILHQAFLNLSTEFGEHLLKVGNPDKAAAVFMRALTFDAMNEGAHAGLIRAYADQGRFPAALRQFDIYADVLKRGYNVPPRPDIVELREALRNRTYVPSQKEPIDVIKPLEAPMVEPEAIPDLPSTIEHTELVKPTLPVFEDEVVAPFVGRTKELDELARIVQEVSARRGMALIITGEMGIGKTRLFNELLKMAGTDYFIGFGEAQEAEGSFPFEGLLQVFDSLGSDARLPAELKSDLADLSQLRFAHSDVAGVGARLTERLRKWVVNLTQRAPVMIALDDLHWASEALLTAFASLAQETKRRPLLLVGIFRTYEAQSESALGGSLVTLARTGRLRRIDLSTLSLDETSMLIHTLAAEAVEKFQPEEMDRLCRFCEGIPLYAIEVAGALQEGETDFVRSPRLEDLPEFAVSTDKLVPALMLKIATLRFQSLDPEARELVKITSLLLGEFSLNLLGKLFSLDCDRLEDILVELEHRNIFQHQEKARGLIFTFSHQMLKLAVSELIPGLEKRRIYARIARTLLDYPEETRSESIAFYLYNAGERAAAVPYLLNGARLWFNAGDQPTGVGYARIAYQTALELFDEVPELLPQTVQVYVEQLQRQGNLKSAIEALNNTIGKIEAGKFIQGRTDLLAKREELKKLLQREPDRSRRDLPLLALVATRRALANVKLMQGDPISAESILDQAEKILDLLNSPPAVRETGMIFLVRAKLHLYRGQIDECVLMTENAMELLKRYGSEADVEQAMAICSEVRAKKTCE